MWSTPTVRRKTKIVCTIGMMSCLVKSKTEDSVKCEVVDGGELSKTIQQRLSLYQGVRPIYMQFSDDAEETFENALGLLQADQRVLLLPASIIYPESKILEWFHYQSRGSFIDVKLPPLCLNCNFLCFALCVVVAFPNPDSQYNHLDSKYHGSSEVTYDCYVKSKDGNRRVESNLFGYPRFSGKPNPLIEMHYGGPDYMKSNHVIIGFGFHFFRELCDNEFSFQFNVENVGFTLYSKHDKGPFKVEMCGVHLISGLHLETSDESEEKDEPHLEEFDEEDESHLEESYEDLKNPMRKMNHILKNPVRTEFDEEDESYLEEFDEEDEPHPKRLKHIE
ncbi:hypothetical protein LWI29_025434 [Acer saccharum]|uniref:C-JID domain-containing protein n=1 Tax=Acer saccharum TaxID=4024 RepID=A0AA39SGF8_ACESA|nr:hypothetical protein LWI29_025434 [Acer saccharum]